MKKRYLQVASLLTLFLFHGLSAVVIWNNNVDFNDSVTNDNLQINGDITFVGAQPITIVVNDGNTYTASLSGDLFIEGDGTQVPLNILVTNGRFKFIIDSDLTFKGLNDQPFFMTAAGAGVLEFEIHGDKKLIFDAPEPKKPGALFYVDMDGNNPPFVEFTRAGNVNKHVEVVVGENSAIGFMAETPIDNPDCPNAQEEGTIRFRAGNTGVGRYVLRILNRGGFIITGQHKTGGGNTPNFNDLDRSTPAGRQARVEVENNKAAQNAPGSLLVINENKTFSRLLINPFDEIGGYTGVLFGFIIGANGLLNILDCAYLDYVGTRLNSQPDPKIPEDILKGRWVKDVVRDRNASAMIIDGFDNSCACNAKLKMDGTSAVYFRSGVDDEGNVEETTFDENGDEIFSFVIDEANKNKCDGNIVLDVEGPFDVVGSTMSTALNILSLQVGITGGTVAIGDTKKLFPLRTFDRDMDDQLLTYNKADFFFNNRMNLLSTVLRHDDRCHKVFEKNSPEPSEPAYIGGETHLLLKDDDKHESPLSFDKQIQRPRIVLINSRIDFHESAAFMGVDIFVPNFVDCGPPCTPLVQRSWNLQDLDDTVCPTTFRKDTCACDAQDNVSALRFFNNGRCLDNGTGRQLILGTPIVCSCNGLTDCDAHLDIMQEFCQDDETKQTLLLEVAQNDATIREEIADQEPIAGQFSIHTIYLGCSSNITIGTNGEMGIDPCGMMFALTTFPTLCITDCFFSFDTQGGPEMLPELSGSTGKGGIFVDANGVIKTDNVRANFSTMVVKSRNAVVDLPKRNVYFNLRVGITEWQLDLTDEDQRVIVKPGECFSNYTLDWINVCKDVCDTVTGFDPFNPCEIPLCTCEGIDMRNITAIPCVEGEVDQFQVKRSRIGDQVHLKVDGTNSCNAKIRELIFLTGWDSAEAPVGLIVLTGKGRVGLGSANRYVDSTQTQTTLGINGITLVPDGNGTVDMNRDLIIDNLCHILPGPNFGVNQETGMNEVQSLTFCATAPRVVRVKSTGVLDLSQLNNFQKVRFAGDARLVLEPGARVLFSPDPENRGTLEFDDTAQFRFECGDTICPIEDIDNVTSTDKIRSKISGTGTILLRNDAQMIILANTIAGIESDALCAPQTDISLQARDNARILIGPQGELGGALQVGNTTEVEGGSVAFELLLDGLGAFLQINSEGYFGLGAGIVQKPSGSGFSPSDTVIGALQQVENVTFNFIEGTFQHNIIDSSNVGIDADERPAGTLAFGPVVNNGLGGYRFIIQNTIDMRILGGGNIINIGPEITNVNTVIDTVDGLISGSVAAGDQVQVGTLSSLFVFLDNGQPGGIKNQIFPGGIALLPPPSADAQNLTGDVIYGILKTPEVETMQQMQANIAIDTNDSSGVNYIFNGTIIRVVTQRITGPLGVPVESSEAHEIGSVGLDVNADGSIRTMTLLI